MLKLKLVARILGMRLIIFLAMAAIIFQLCPTEVYAIQQSSPTTSAMPKFTANNPAPYIHQCWDTLDTFDGRSACGSTTAVMIAAAFGKLAARADPVSGLYPDIPPHNSAYGYYVSEIYTNNGITYSWTAPALNGQRYHGAYGYITNEQHLAVHSLARDYLRNHGLSTSDVIPSPTETYVQTALGQSHLIYAATTIQNLDGHVILIKGYDSSTGKYIVNDPFGKSPYANLNVGTWDGADVQYTWSYMQVKHIVDVWDLQPSLPGAPALTSPINGVNAPGTSVTFYWTAPTTGTGIDNYYLRVNTNSSFTGTDIFSNTVGYVGNKTVSGLSNTGGTYYWFVLAHNAAGWGPYSSTNFINGTTPSVLPGAPALTSPINGVNAPGTSVTFYWTAPTTGTGIDNYYLRVNTNSSFTGTDIFSNTVGYVGNKTVSGLSNTGGTYYWFVLAHNAAGWGPYSSTNFINGTASVSVPGAPPLSSPAPGANVPGTSVTFSWTAPSGTGIDNYWLRVNTNSGFTGTDIYSGGVGYVGSKTVSGFPNTGGTYYWYVLAHNGAGWGPASSTRNFINGAAIALPGAPPLSSPAPGANVVGTQVTFSWTAPSGTGIDGYYLRVNTNSGFTGTDIYSGGVGYVGSKTVSGFPNTGGTYYWYVLAHNGAGWGPASSTRNFINGAAIALPGAPPLSSPAPGANVAGTQVTFSWTAPSGTGIDNYYLRVNTNSSFTGTDVYSSAVGYRGSITLTGAPNNGATYYWYVVAHNAAGWGAASSARSFINGP